jgi:hypothetical protein
MTLGRGWLVCWVLCLGCQSFALPEEAESQPQAESGERPLGYYDPTVAQDPAASRSDLAVAAEQLQAGNEAAACEHLGKYLARHPEHFEARQHYAELLAALDRPEAAQAEFARCVAQAQEHGPTTLARRVQCHARLVELAEADDDQYGRRLHRGIGLYLLAVQRAKLGDPGGDFPVEALLCRAAGDLTVAHGRQPVEARPCWYLYKVWSAAGKQAVAMRWLQRARAAAPFTTLTPAERRGLELACRAADRSPLPH